jgi:glucose-1-phosphate adenylyltransferase
VESSRGKVLALVLAGGAGGRLDVLTRERAKPAMPFAGVYRLIDFPLSNCHHSRVSDVWVLQQYEPGLLTRHLANGRPWDLDRTHGGLRVVHPYLGDEESGWYRGNADAIYRNREEIRAFDPELLLVLSADHVYKLDYGAVIERHRECRADATVVTTRVPVDEAGRFGTVQVDDGRIVDFAYKPDEPESELVTAEVFVYDAAKLLALVDELADGGDEAADFGDELLPRLVAEGGAHAYPLDGYWKDVGTIESYWGAHMDLLGDDPAFGLADPAWPILTRDPQRPPARIDGGRIEDSLVSPGAIVRGAVARSVLGPGVVVEAGASVRESVILDDTVLERGCVVERAIVDTRVTVGRRARVGGADGAITVVGGGTRVPPDATLEPGERTEPDAAATTA